MNARAKFLVAVPTVALSTGFLMASSIKCTGVYGLTPAELGAKIRRDTSFHEDRGQGPATPAGAAA